MSGPWSRGLLLPSERHPRKAFLWLHQFVHADHHVAHWVISDAFHANFTICRLAIRSPKLKAIDGPLRSAKRMALVLQGLIKAHLIAWMFDHSKIINQVVSTNTCLWIIAYIGFFWIIHDLYAWRYSDSLPWVPGSSKGLSLLTHESISWSGKNGRNFFDQRQSIVFKNQVLQLWRLTLSNQVLSRFLWKAIVCIKRF